MLCLISNIKKGRVAHFLLKNIESIHLLIVCFFFSTVVLTLFGEKKKGRKKSDALNLVGLLVGKGETDSLVGNIEVRVVFTQEDVSHDEESVQLLGEVQGLNSQGAGFLSGGGDSQHIVFRGESEGHSVQDEVNVGQGAQVGAIFLNGSDLSLDVKDGLGFSNQDRGTGIDDTILNTDHGVSVDVDGVKLEEPVRLRDQRDVLEFSVVQTVVLTAQDHQRSFLSGVLAQEEREGVVVQQVALDDGEEEGSLSELGNCRPGHTADTIKLGENEGNSAKFGDFSEQVVIDGKSSDGDVIGTGVTRDGSTSVRELERLSDGVIGGRFVGVVGFVQVTGDGSALGGWQPQVAGTGIEKNGEGLRRGTDGQFSVVLGVFVVVDHIGVGAVSGRVFSGQEFDFSALGDGVSLSLSSFLDSVEVGNSLLFGFVNWFEWDSDQFSRGVAKDNK